MSASGITVRPLAPGDVQDATQVHLEAFPGFFLSALGPAFVRELYRGFCRLEDSMGFVAVGDNGRVIGVVAGTSRPAAFFRRLLARRWYAFAMAALPAVLRRPLVLRRVLRGLTYRGDAPDPASGALLSSIAVAPSAQGSGAGSALVQAFCHEAAQRGVARVYLMTDHDHNDAINCFYQRQGFQLTGIVNTPEGRAMNRYVYENGE